MSTTRMQDPPQDAMTGELGLSHEELGWIARVTPSILRKLTGRAGKAAGERALQAVRAELWGCRKLLAEIPTRSRKAWLHTLVMRAVGRAAERDLVQSQSAAPREHPPITRRRTAEYPDATLEITPRGVVDENAAVQHDLRTSILVEDLAMGLALLEPREYEILSLKLWTSLGIAEIAARMQMTPEAVAKALRRTTQYLRMFLKRS